MLSRLIVIKSIYNNEYACRKEGGRVVVGEKSVLSTLVKIEVERAKSNNNYIHLRFCNSNKYWQRDANDRFIVAESNKPVEDTTKPSCTMFEVEDDNNGFFHLIHVHSRGRVCVEDGGNMVVYVKGASSATYSCLGHVNWETLVKLPKHVAFKGYNDNYLKAIVYGIPNEKKNFLELAADDPNHTASGFQITSVPDGHVQICSDHFNKYWRRTNDYNNWIWAESIDAWKVWADSSDASLPYDVDTLFWPVKIDDNTVAFRSARNQNFIKGHDCNGFTFCLSAALPTITNEARLRVEELVSHRKIYNVRYRMEDARIFNEMPFAAGTTTAFNYGDTEAGISVEVCYEDSKSHSFSRSLSLKAGVTTSFEVGLPWISKGSVQVNFEISKNFQWNDTTTSRASVKATGSVQVPPRSMATVSYVGTMGSCDVHFSYTQQDKSSTDGRVIETDLVDGVFRGVNAYNFSFVVDQTKPL